MKIVYRGEAPEIEVFHYGVFHAGVEVEVTAESGEALLRIKDFYRVDNGPITSRKRAKEEEHDE